MQTIDSRRRQTQYIIWCVCCVVYTLCTMPICNGIGVSVMIGESNQLNANRWISIRYILLAEAQRFHFHAWWIHQLRRATTMIPHFMFTVLSYHHEPHIIIIIVTVIVVVRVENAKGDSRIQIVVDTRWIFVKHTFQIPTIYIHIKTAAFATAAVIAAAATVRMNSVKIA